MLTLLRSLTSPLISLVFMMIASGLFGTFTSIRLQMEGHTAEEIGIVTSASYLGVLLGSIWIDRMICKIGHIRAFTACAATLGFLALAQSLWVDTWYWSCLRMLGGMCMAGIFIVIESWFLIQSGPTMRGAALSIYLAVFYAALSFGQLLIDIADPMGFFPFIITAGFSFLAIFPVLTSKIPIPPMPEHVKVSVSQLFKISPLGFIGSVISGILLATVYSLVPVYAKEIGMDLSQIGIFMAILIFGGFCWQLPIGRWADKTDRRKVLNITSFSAVILSLCLASAAGFPYAVLCILAWFFGGVTFTLYPLSMAYACQNVKESQIVAVTGGFVLSYGLGAIVGPLAAPLSFAFLGSSGLFYFIAALCFILGFVGLKRPASVIIDE
jgi:MFS family permease